MYYIPINKTMLQDTADIDMEDLEARLYGQVHYANLNDEDPFTNPNKDSPASPNVNERTRYYTNFQPLPGIYQAYSQMPPLSDTNMYGQLGLMLNPAAVNNIVVVQQPPAQIYTENNNRKRKAKAGFWKRQRHKREQKKLRRVSSMFKEHHLNKPIESYPNEAVSDAFCEIIEPKMDLVIISSDEESGNIKKVEDKTVESVETVLNKSIDTDDVIFIEPKPAEIINIDCDDASITVDDGVVSPDTSVDQNDFLEECALLSSTMITNNVPDTSQTSNTNADVSDSESSCATSESQSRIFKEHAFETADQNVSALNLNDFEHYMASSGTFVSDLIATNCTADSKTSRDKSSKQCSSTVTRNSSDSSSESDYNDDDVDTSLVVTKQVNKNLPDLSPIVSDDDYNTSEVNSNTYMTIKGESSTSDGINTSVVCISSSDESSDVEVIMGDSIELLNIEGSDVPKQNETTPKTKKGTITKSFSDFWTDDMRKFYDESWGQENYSVEEEQKKMSDDPNMWKICKEDLTNLFNTPKRVRCHRCRQFGHRAVNCSNKSGIPKCILCGHDGHYESRCPNKLCASCGTKVPFWAIYCHACNNLRHTFCNICSLQGHLAKNCTDLWRRYYLTVSEGPPVCPENSTPKPPQGRWCCGCVSQGHYEHECNYTLRTYPKTSPFVQSYDDVYGYSKSSANQNRQTNQNCVPPTKIPSLLDIQIDPNTILSEQLEKERPTVTQFGLMASEAQQLLNRAGVRFLKVISKNTDLQIRILKQGRKAATATYICIIEGSNEYKDDAITKIKEFCEDQTGSADLLKLFSSKAITKNRLRHNFHNLQKELPWTELLKRSYDRIMKCERDMQGKSVPYSIRKRNKKTIKLHFTALNAALIAKFHAGNQHHLQLLRTWSTSETNFVDEAVKNAYRYVFQNCQNANIDYEKVISATFPHSIKEQIDDLVNRSIKFCCDLNLIKEIPALEAYHRLAIESNYTPPRVSFLKKYCKTLRVKNLRKVQYL